MRKHLHQGKSLVQKHNRLKEIATTKKRKVQYDSKVLQKVSFLFLFFLLLNIPMGELLSPLMAASIKPTPKKSKVGLSAADFTDDGILKSFMFAPNEPLAVMSGFNVLAKGSMTLQNGEIEGPIAMWNDLNMDGTFNVAISNPGTFVVSGDTRPTGMVIEGRVNYISGNGINLLSNSLVKIKDLTGSVIHDLDNGNPTNTRITPNGFNDIPKIQVSLHQPAANVGPLDVFNFSGTFNTLQTESNTLNSYTNNVNTQVQGAGRIKLFLTNNRVNVWNVDAATLGSLIEISFNSPPDLSKPLLINVTTGANFTWTIPNLPGISDLQGPFILWNFANTSGTITLQGGSTLIGSILAPQANLIKGNTGNLNGQIAVNNYTHVSGEVHYYPLEADFSGGPVDCGCGNTLFTNGGYETFDPTTTFPVNFRGNNARDLTNSSTNVLTEWQPALATPRMYFINDVVNRVNNPDGNYFVWLPALNDCYRTKDNIGLTLGLEHGVEYVLCFYASPWTEVLDANGYPTGANSPQQDGAIKMEFLTQSGAFIETNTFQLDKSNNWTNQNWGQYSVRFTYDSSDPIRQIFFTNASADAGVSIDGVTLRKVDCNAGNNWSFDCNDNRKVDIYGAGRQCQSNTTISIPNPSNLYQEIVEIVYKGTKPGSSLNVTAGGNTYNLPEVPVSGGSSSVYVYRGRIPVGVSSVSFNNAPSNCSLQSVLVYAFRNNVMSMKQSGILTEKSGYNNIQTINIPVPTASAPRNMNITVPISELTADGRYLLIQAEAGGVSTQRFLYGPNTAYGACCLDIVNLTLSEVPGSANMVTLTIDTRNWKNGHTVNGQSYVVAGSVMVDTECTEICGNGLDDDGDGLVDCDDPYCTPAS
ncbi:MAG: choice-of-anchor A family protein, partial [Saprospiraceae bacterium]